MAYLLGTVEFGGAGEDEAVLVNQPCRAARQPRPVCSGRVEAGPELVEVAPATERRARPDQMDGGDRLVDHRQLQSLGQLVAHAGGDRVVTVRSVEPYRQLRPVAAEADGDVLIGDCEVGCGRPPSGELGPRLQGGVDGRLGCQAGFHVGGGHRTQQHRQ
ncbi:MAG: hypothetical protein WCK21_01875 [Actinomycetota bacterium]